MPPLFLMQFSGKKQAADKLPAACFIVSLWCRSALLEHGGNAHAAADAQGSQTLLGVGTLGHLVQQSDDDTSIAKADLDLVLGIDEVTER